jgi:hypothetical protein
MALPTERSRIDGEAAGIPWAEKQVELKKLY